MNIYDVDTARSIQEFAEFMANNRDVAGDRARAEAFWVMYNAIEEELYDLEQKRVAGEDPSAEDFVRDLQFEAEQE